MAVVISGGKIPEIVRDEESMTAHEGIQVAPERTALYEAVERHLEVINSGKEIEKLELHWTKRSAKGFSSGGGAVSSHTVNNSY